MSNVKIETLTPVHIGSGNFLNNNSDFFCEQIEGDNYLIVISENKIGKLLGNKSSEFIDLWLHTIARKGDVRQFISKFAPNAITKDYAKRKILLYNNVNPSETLKECIHNGMGLPYIPGSSIKGALRTAILTSLANNIKGVDEKIIVKIKDRNGDFVPKKDKHGNVIINANMVEKELFGNDPNRDVFRFIQVGDAYFEEETEIATRLINLNIRINEERLKDTLKSQIVEAIGSDSKSEFQLKVAKDYYDFVKSKFSQAGNLPVSSIGDLFRIINDHTRKLVEDEINYWNDVEKSGGDDYVNEMKKILQTIINCQTGTSCVLRIGHASGWRFITGAWAENLQNFNQVVVPASRPSNHRYAEYDFPKTRRLDEESYILGFVKLTVV